MSHYFFLFIFFNFKSTMQNFHKLIKFISDSELIFNRLGYSEKMINDAVGEFLVQTEVL